MAIHDDNWTKEIPDMYTYSKRERIWAASMAAFMVLIGGMMVWPKLYTILEIPLVVTLVTVAAWTLYYFLRVAIRGR